MQDMNSPTLPQKKILICQETLKVPDFAGVLSTFERVIHFGQQKLPKKYEKWNFQVCRLLSQCQMRPEISGLLRASLVNELEDGESMLHLDDVAGLSQNVGWFDHSSPEAKSQKGGFRNLEEAELCFGLVRHILSQESSRLSDVAILTPYNQQCKLLKQRCMIPDLYISTV